MATIMSLGIWTTSVLGIAIMVIIIGWVSSFLERKWEATRWAKFIYQTRSTRHKYKYSSLQSETKMIRLVELFPNEDSNEPPFICLCDISLADSQHVPYEALSYCWGSTKDLSPVFCSDGSIFWVTKNLYTALQRLRHVDQPRILWADALCINQSDNAEKSWQVAMMGDVYHGAERVLIWLGPDADFSDRVESFLPKLLRAKDMKYAAGDDRDWSQLSAAESATYGAPPFNLNGVEYYALAAIMSREWFQRVWIIQELVFAKEAVVFCGGWSASWETLLKAWRFVVEDLDHRSRLNLMLQRRAKQPQMSINGFQLPLELTRKQVLAGARPGLLDLLGRHHTAQATKPVDKIFALVGVSGNQEGIEINYDKSNSDTFQNAASRVIKKERNLDILSFTSCLSRDDSSLPSWVPDWSSEEVTFSLNVAYDPAVENEWPDFKELLRFQATKDSICRPNFSHDGRRITVSGLELDSVESVGPVRTTLRDAFPRAGWAQGLEEYFVWAEWFHLSQSSTNGVDVRTGNTNNEVFWQTLLLGIPGEDVAYGLKAEIDRIIPLLRSVEFFRGLPLLHAWLLTKILGLLHIVIFNFGIVFPMMIGRDPATMELLRLMGAFSSGRRGILTKRGWFGLSSGHVKVGDVLILLEGGKTAYVIRNTTRENEYQFVGDCYIHGIMHGERWDKELCKEITLI